MVTLDGAVDKDMFLFHVEQVLVPVLVAGALASVRHLKASQEERASQQAGATMLKAKFRDAGLPVMDSVTHIVPLLVGCPVKAKRISVILLA